MGNEALVILSKEYEEFILDYVKHLLEARPGIGSWAHLGKVIEEAGEASTALGLMQKMNPRKAEEGQTASAWDVVMEYGDVIMTACVAIVAMGYGPDQVLEAQKKKTEERAWW
jgi:phosphoribosyl-ATP pyrophosphohydrolase